MDLSVSHRLEFYISFCEVKPMYEVNFGKVWHKYFTKFIVLETGNTARHMHFFSPFFLASPCDTNWSLRYVSKCEIRRYMSDEQEFMCLIFLIFSYV